FSRDWSSDVCSSDLNALAMITGQHDDGVVELLGLTQGLDEHTHLLVDVGEGVVVLVEDLLQIALRIAEVAELFGIGVGGLEASGDAGRQFVGEVRHLEVDVHAPGFAPLALDVTPHSLSGEMIRDDLFATGSYQGP